MDSKSQFESPFGKVEHRPPKFNLNAIFLLIVINALISSLLMLAGRVPMISNTVSDLMGRPRVDAGQVDRMVHLVFLFACYTAPMAITSMVSLAYVAVAYFKRTHGEASKSETDGEDDPDWLRQPIVDRRSENTSTSPFES